MDDFTLAILEWYKAHKRKFSWRETDDPYRILVAEILLHRTDSKKAEKVYHRLVKECPTIYHLYRIDFQKIQSLIRDIGLFYRAERLKRIADQVVCRFNGRIPDNGDDLMLLCGVGHYISNAVLCFAFKKRVPIVDTNVIRVYARVFDLKSSKPRPHTDKKLWIFAEKMLPGEQYVEYNYALLDFASSICRARHPLCNICEVKPICENPVE